TGLELAGRRLAEALGRRPIGLDLRHWNAPGALSFDTVPSGGPEAALADLVRRVVPAETPAAAGRAVPGAKRAANDSRKRARPGKIILPGAPCRGRPGRPFRPATDRTLLLLRGDQHHHLPALGAGPLLDDDVLAQVLLDPLRLRQAEFLVAHLTATEADGDLHLVPLLQEATHVAQLDLVVAFVRGRAELDFLDLDLLLLLLRRVGLLLLLEAVLAVVHDAADGRVGVGLDLDQIQTGLLGHVPCPGTGHGRGGRTAWTRPGAGR